ncbi:MAG: hypothetical protein FJ308_11740 [Planctomycetes bacterium]|nr:hypothetical protein [Planctomycetota bacterium]
MMYFTNVSVSIALVSSIVLQGLTVYAQIPTPPDLTRGETKEVERDRTYNLGATGMRGWIYTKPANFLDSVQGRTTDVSRQILVTHVGKKSPADGIVRVDDIILGVDGTPFSVDARKSLAVAIQQAETEVRGGKLNLVLWRDGQQQEVQLQLRVMGTYGTNAPFECAKSEKIFDEACRILEKERLQDDLWGAVNCLALMSTGNEVYLPKVREYARKHAPKDLKLTLKPGMVTWEWGYKNLFLCEYYLLTGDEEVLPAIREYTISLAKGQSLYGTFGHGVAPNNTEGELHGSIPPYGPVNATGLISNLSIVLGKRCGVSHPEIDPAIERAANFFGFFADKGGIPYGEHEPWPYHENNGKNAMAAVMFSLIEQRESQAQGFAKMCAAAYRNREYGHTGQGFSYLWGVLGANAGGPEAAAAFFAESSWHLDLVRRSDGSFTYDGDEQYGGGKTHNDSYYGRSSYYGLSPTACYVLSYSVPRKKLLITGRESDSSNWLSTEQVRGAIASGRFDLDRKGKTVQELVDAFSDWSPIVRDWAADELARRPESRDMIPELIVLLTGDSVPIAQGACESLGLLKSTEALPAFVKLLYHPDRWLRFKAAKAIRALGDSAKPALSDILIAVAETAEPLKPIVWQDPIQLTHGQLAAALFSGPLADDVQKADPKLLYPAVRAVSKNADGMARATLNGFFDKRLTVDDVQALAPDILEAVRSTSPADTMFSNEIRMGGFKALTKYHFKEGIEAGVLLAKTQGGHGSESRTGLIMKEIKGYGSAAREAIPQLQELIQMFNDQCDRGEFPSGELNDRRVNAVRDAIQSIQTAESHPPLRTAIQP